MTITQNIVHVCAGVSDDGGNQVHREGDQSAADGPHSQQAVVSMEYNDTSVRMF